MGVKKLLKDRGCKWWREEWIFNYITDVEGKYNSADG
jgi:hypothetical protein